MTEQIKSAIEWCEEFEIAHDLKGGENNNFMYAIRSLKAWEEVLQELENFDVDEYLKDEGHRFGFNEGICYVLELINQKLEQMQKGAEE